MPRTVYCVLWVSLSLCVCVCGGGGVGLYVCCVPYVVCGVLCAACCVPCAVYIRYAVQNLSTHVQGFAFLAMPETCVSVPSIPDTQDFAITYATLTRTILPNSIAVRFNSVRFVPCGAILWHSRAAYDACAICAV